MEYIKSMKDVTVFDLVIAIVAIVVLSILAYQSMKPPVFKSGTFVTHAVLVGVQNQRNSNVAEYEYQCQGKKYIYKRMIRATYNIGDMFEIIVDSTNCENADLNEARPIFLPGEETQLIKGKIYAYSSILKSIKFEYLLGGDAFERLQYISDEEIKMLNESNNRVFQVEYLVSNPTRCRMILLTNAN